jgi:cytochrome c oxidase subunit II
MNAKRSILCLLMSAGAAHAESRTENLFWTPQNVTVGGSQVDSILNFIFILTAAVFVITQGVYIYYLVRYRRRKGVKADYFHGHNLLELVWTAIPLLVFVGLAVYSNVVWNRLHRDPPPDAIPINVSAYQFNWDIRYPGADGKLGVTDVALISNDNKFGVPPNDPAGLDDFTSNELVVPVGRPVHIFLNSRDVIHSFYVPNFRLYQDAVPGRTISWVWFQVSRPGNFELACSQLCGAGHYNMKAPIRALPPADYDKWFAEKVKARQAEIAKAAQTHS